MIENHLKLIIKLSAYLIAFIFAHWPSNWMIRKIIKKWKPDEKEPSDRMGAFIGTLERILTVLLVGLEAYSAIGFVIAMKSVVRYERMQKERAFAEYFLAGTMLSVLVSLVLGLLVQRSVGKL